MRNLKRALSLTLASVMLLGMMVVGAGAAAGYDDVTADNNVEAIEVLQTVEVMVGDERGFGPDRPVNRAEMAVIMGKLLNLDYNYYSAACPFNDVYDWARGWVGACYANGIVSGRGDGIYDPGATVTAVEAASMLMRALGYFRYQNDYEDGFVLATVKQGNKIGIFDNVGSSADAPMTRDQVAQIVLNALKTGMVEPDGNTTTFLNPDGSVLATTGKVNYVYVTSNKDFAKAISSVRASSIGSTNDSPIVELGEQLYNGKLKLNEDQLDAFDRPARRWEYDGKEIGTYVKKELLKAEYTTKVTGKMLYDLLGPAVTEVQPLAANTYSFVIAIDGEDAQGASGVLENSKGDDFSFDRNDMIRTNTDGVGGTGNGVLTQVYVDGDKKIVYIAVMNTYLGIAAEDYDERNDEVDLDVYNVEDTNNDPKNPFYVKVKYHTSADDSINITVPGDKFAVENVKDGDMFLVRVANGEVQEMVAPEVISDATATAFKMRSDDSPEYVIADGTQYDAANTALYDIEVLDEWTGNDKTNLKNLSYNIILDHYGYMIGVELNENPNQYVFITGNEGGSSNLGNTNVDMGAIFLDGTFKVITVNVKDSKDSDATGSIKAGGPIINTWCTYTVDKNGVYTLKQVADDIDTANKVKVAQHDMDAVGGEINIDKKHVSVDAATGKAYGNDDTVYLNVTLSAITSKKTFEKDEQDDVDSTSHKYHTDDVTNASGSALAAIIDEVESVTVGVKNADIKVNDVTVAKVAEMDGVADYDELVLPVNEIYALYDKDMYVIAAVVIGEAQYSNSSYAYINSNGINRESYDKDADEWTWNREAIVNGEVVTLREVGSSIKYLDELDRGHWYKLAYDADGNVRGVTALDGNASAKTLDDGTYDDGFISRVDKVETAVEEEDFVILRVMFRDDDHAHTSTHSSICDDHYYASSYQTGSEAKGVLTFKNGTLYTNEAQTEGFSVSPSVKVILAQASATKEFNKLYTSYPTGYTGLERALRALDLDEDDKFSGDVSAILEGGVATTIIINDIGKMANGEGGSNNPNPNPPTPETGVNADPTGAANIDEYAPATMTVDFVHGGKTAAQVAEEALKAKGYTITARDVANKKITVTKDGVSTEFAYTPTEYFKVTVDSTDYYVTKDGKAKGENTEYQLPLNADTYSTAATDGTGYQDGEGAYQAYAATSTKVGIKTAAMGSDTAITDNKTIKTGYVDVTEGSVTDASSLMTVSYEVNGEAVALGDLATAGAPVGATLKVILTAKADIKNAATFASAFKVQFDDQYKSAVVSANAAKFTVAAPAANNTVTSTDNTDGAVVLPKDATITATYEVGHVDFTTTDGTVTAAA